MSDQNTAILLNSIGCTLIAGVVAACTFSSGGGRARADAGLEGGVPSASQGGSASMNNDAGPTQSGSSTDASVGGASGSGNGTSNGGTSNAGTSNGGAANGGTSNGGAAGSNAGAAGTDEKSCENCGSPDTSLRYWWNCTGTYQGAGEVFMTTTQGCGVFSADGCPLGAGGFTSPDIPATTVVGTSTQVDFTLMSSSNVPYCGGNPPPAAAPGQLCSDYKAEYGYIGLKTTGLNQLTLPIEVTFQGNTETEWRRFGIKEDGWWLCTECIGDSGSGPEVSVTGGFGSEQTYGNLADTICNIGGVFVLGNCFTSYQTCN